MKATKPNSPLWPTLALILSLFAAYLLAQQVSPPTKPSRLDEAVALINEGKPQQAREVIATIEASDPEYGLARYYDAVASHDTKDSLGFLRALEALPTNGVSVPPELQEELALRQMGALFHYRKFEELIPKTEAFSQVFPGSMRSSSSAEYRLAALFERGMKKTIEACATKDERQFNKRWGEGKPDLERFLSLAALLPGTNYTVLPKRKFTEDVWVARMTLGDENAALEEIPVQDVAAREKLSRLRLQLYLKLQPAEVDRNLRMMSDFIAQFPESKSRKRVEFDMASISFPRGEALSKEAEIAEMSGDAAGAAAKRTKAREYFETLRLVHGRATVDKESGIEPSDIVDLNSDLLYSHFLEKNDSALASLAASMTAAAQPGDLNWMVAQVYEGIRLASQNPGDWERAAATFDEVIRTGFKNKPDHDYYVIRALRWRSYVALKLGDTAKPRELLELVQAAECTKNLQEGFLTDHTTLVSSLLAASRTEPSNQTR